MLLSALNFKYVLLGQASALVRCRGPELGMSRGNNTENSADQGLLSGVVTPDNKSFRQLFNIISALS
jgi:hypothetical protein